MVVMPVRRIILLTLIWMLPAVAMAGLTARFDRDSIHINETVRLVIETDGGSARVPDLSAVEKHFNVLSQATSRNVSIVDGQQSTVLRHIIELEPRQEGSFSIDPIRLDGEATPIMRITVLPEQTANGQGPELFIEGSVDRDTVYVQQQLILTVRLFVAPRLLDGSLADPAPSSTRVERLGEDKRYQSSRDGRDYRVYERNYALFPQQSGELEIPPVHFQGLAEERGESAGQVFGSLLNPGRRVRARSEAIKITVKPPSPQFTGRTWLPVSQLQIDEVGDIDERVEAGQPLTRKIQLQARGLTAEQLPEIEFGEVDGVRFYPDKPVRDTALADGVLVAVRQDNVAVIGSEAGMFTLPAIEIDWWNTVSDKPEKAVLPARTVEILPSSVTPASPASPAAESLGSGNDLEEIVKDGVAVGDSEQPSSSLQPSSLDPPVWKAIAIGAIALWLVTLAVVLMVWRHRRLAGTPDVARSNSHHPVSTWSRQLKKACRENNATEARRALAGWASSLGNKNPSLQQLVATLDNPELMDAIRDLDQHLYASGASTPGAPTPGASGEWRGDRLWKAFAKLPPPDTGKSGSLETLIPLYPETARS